MTECLARKFGGEIPCARRRHKEYLLNSPLTIESSTLAFHGISKIGGNATEMWRNVLCDWSV